MEPSSATFSDVDRARSHPGAVSESVEEGETGNSGEEAVGRHEGDANVNGTRSNPQVVGVNGIGQGMAGVAAMERRTAASVARSPSLTGITVVAAMARSSCERRGEPHWATDAPYLNSATVEAARKI